MARIDQIQMVQAHGLHRPRRRADIARMGGMAEDNSYIAHNILIIQTVIPTNGHGKYALLHNETRNARFPFPDPPPQTGEGEVDTLREFHVKIRNRNFPTAH